MDAKIEEVKQEIRKVEQQIAYVEEQLTKADTKDDVAYLQKEKEQLRKEKEQLRKEKEQLREKELLLLKADTSEGEPISKKPKRSPAEPQPLDPVLESTAAEECSYFSKLLATPHELPLSVADLKQFLSQKTEKLPVLKAQTYLKVNAPGLVKLFSPAEIQVANLVEFLLKRSMTRPHNEADSSHILRTLSGDFLEELNSLAPPEQKLRHLELTMDSGRVPSSSSAVSALQPLWRPDFALFMRSALVLRWENKIDPLDFNTAMEENSEKLKLWSPLYYGELPYVIGGCCGGRMFQWLKLSPISDNVGKCHSRHATWPCSIAQGGLHPQGFTMGKLYSSKCSG